MSFKNQLHELLIDFEELFEVFYSEEFFRRSFKACGLAKKSFFKL
jgi:hypothetical protein